MKIKQIMKDTVAVLHEDATLFDAAKKMKELGIGSIPIRDGDVLVGMLTDRDIVVKGIAEGRDPRQTPVLACVSHPIVCVYEDQEAEEAAQIMEANQIRRLPVINNYKKLVGIISLSDLKVLGNNEQLTRNFLKKVIANNEYSIH